MPFHTLRRARAVTAALALSSLTLVTLAGTAAVPAQAAPTKPARTTPAADTREPDPALTKAKRLTKAEQKTFRGKATRAADRAQRAAAAAEADGPATGGASVGTEKNWLLLDETAGYSPASYVLQAVNPHIEVWVQKNLDYPTGDCRNDGVRNVVTREQAQSLADEFENNILPKESVAFSVATSKDGTNPDATVFGDTLANLIGGGDPGYFAGDGDKTVALVSNVRDANYYAPTTPDGATYIAGFFSPTYTAAFDRNMMTIDSYDWLHRTGANPPDETPTQPALCSARQGARARSYEGIFAHEYQHLLQNDRDPDEVTWLNEGLSDYAQTVVGYVDTRLQYPAKGADSHISCFEGFYGSADFPYCGAENSLTRWEDQGSPSVLADYGAAYTFLTYLSDQFGDEAIKYLHLDDANGLRSLQDYLDDNAPGLTSMDVLHDWQAAMAVDGWLDRGAKGLNRDQRSRFSSAKLHAAVDWAWTGSYDSPGAPANGSDYVLGIARRPVNKNTVRSMSFTGAKSYAPDPLAWTVSDGALYSGEGDDLDRSAVYAVSVPTGKPALTFSSRYDIEQGWDFGVVQVSTDGGKTYTSLPGTGTTTSHNPAADPRIVAQLPGLTGRATTYTTRSYDLSAYAGRSVQLAFRYLTDAASNGNGGDAPTGWWVKDVRVGATVVTDGTTLAGARSATEVSPVPVAGWSVQMVGWSLDGRTVRYRDLTLDEDNHVAHSRAWLKKRFKGVDRIGFIVSVDDPAETATKNAAYALRVNGVLQPGGAGDTDATGTDPALLTQQLPVSVRRTVR